MSKTIILFLLLLLKQYVWGKLIKDKPSLCHPHKNVSVEYDYSVSCESNTMPFCVFLVTPAVMNHVGLLTLGIFSE